MADDVDEILKLQSNISAKTKSAKAPKQESTDVDEILSLQNNLAQKLKIDKPQVIEPPEDLPIGLQVLKGVAESPVGKGLAKIGETIDPFTGAPVRAAIGAAQVGESPLSAFTKQFGETSSLAPTGKDIASKAGLSKEETISVPGFGKVSPAGMAGLAIDITADPTNIIPGGAIAKLGIKGTVKVGKPIAKLAGKMALRGSAAAADFLSGSKTGTKTVKLAGDLVETSKDALSKVFSPKIAKDKERLFAIAQKNNIDPNDLPSAIEFGKESVISRADRKLGEGVLGEKLLDQHKNVTQKINDAFQSRIETMSKGKPITDFNEGGQLIRDGLDEMADQVFKDADTTYASIYKSNPGLRVPDEALAKLDSTLAGIAKRAKGVIKRGITKERTTPAKQLLVAIDKIKSTKGNYKQLTEQLQEIGQVAFKNKNIIGRIPPDIANLRKMYFGISDSLLGTARKLSPELADQLEFSNGILTEFFTDASPIARFTNNKNIANEKLFQNLVKNGDTLQLDSLRKVMPEEKFAKLRGAYVNGLGRKNINDLVSYNSLNKEMAKKIPHLKIMLSPQEIIDIKELVELGDRIGVPTLTSSGPREVFELTKGKIGKDLSLQQTVKFLKERARNQGASKAQVKKLGDAAAKNDTVSIGKILKDLPKAKRGPREKFLKGAQVISVQDQEESAIDRRLRSR